MAPSPDAAFVLPVNVWVNGAVRRSARSVDLRVRDAGSVVRGVTWGRRAPGQYVSPDGSLVLPAGRVFRQPASTPMPGMDDDRLALVAQPRRLRPVTARAGPRIFVVSGAENRTYRARSCRPTARWVTSRRLPSAAGESVAADSAGNVYVAQRADLRLRPVRQAVGQIDVPERPIGLASAERIGGRCSSSRITRLRRTDAGGGRG